MTTEVENIGVCRPGNPRVALATQARGHRDNTKLACRLTLQPPANGQWPAQGAAYTVTFRDVGQNRFQEWNVTCTYVPMSKTEPFEFTKS
ncbi:MAG TPA: hypothetical protein VFU65_10655 [Actinocrinis sp.]|nr:hypothetical protein [Actinocrinis sp.]